MLDSYKKITNALVNWINRVRSANRGLSDSLVSREVQSKFLESVKYVGPKSFVLDSLAEMSILHSQSYILAVVPNMQLQNIKVVDIGVYSVSKDWTSVDHASSSHIDLHKQIYEHTGSRAVLLCHPSCAYIMQQEKLKPVFSPLPGLQEIIDGYAVVSLDDFCAQLENNHFLFIPEIGLFSHAADLMQATNQVEAFEWLCSINLALNRYS